MLAKRQKNAHNTFYEPTHKKRVSGRKNRNAGKGDGGYCRSKNTADTGSI